MRAHSNRTRARTQASRDLRRLGAGGKLEEQVALGRSKETQCILKSARWNSTLERLTILTEYLLQGLFRFLSPEPVAAAL